GPALVQKSMQRPFFSQSPYRVGSRRSWPSVGSAFDDPGGVPCTTAATGLSIPAGSGPAPRSPKMSWSSTSESLVPAPMSDKPIQTHGDFFTIPGWSVVALRGPDAVRFAQAQFMSDVASL